ncbi:hypothetical protein CYMTET_56825 [Cymbomonas tetramitiformis]|uniref:Uncharacterized protein n=1 Tax=Cymbomonas tetramitiformis TaxID=36881 RepID=A0AAE0BA35_9CHLO|nr:hypothetical protein CYMTET_56825 [Cymbomonas tetramitiformis]
MSSAITAQNVCGLSASRKSINTTTSPKGMRGSALSIPRVHNALSLKRSARETTLRAAESEVATSSKVVTVEEQRAAAKELVKYFENRNYYEEYLQSRVFGWTKNAEITNARWVMFGLLVGMMTEYATGVNFVGQVQLTITNLGFADIYE